MNKLIAITTDFQDEFAVAQLHAVCATLGFDGKLIENHSVTPFSIIEGAFQIQSLAQFTPEGTVHLGVIDPGVGSKRRGIIIKNHKSWYIGPDNGLLYPAAKSAGIDSVWTIDEKAVTHDYSNTFHGRDVFIKTAVYLSQGKNPDEFGCKKITRGKIKSLKIKKGTILTVDTYGNIKIFWPEKIALGDFLEIKIEKKYIKIPYVRTFAEVPALEPLFYTGSNGTLELALNLGNAAVKFNLKSGDILKIRKVQHPSKQE